MSCKFVLFAAAVAGFTLPSLSAATAQQFATPPAFVFNGVPTSPYAGDYAPRRYAVAACARHFRSFDVNTGTYSAPSGVRVLCPYLRG